MDDEQVAAAIAKFRKRARSQRRERDTDIGAGAVVLSPPGQPMAVARLLVDEHFTADGCLTLRHWRGSWWHWQTSHWIELEDRAARGLLYRFVEHAIYYTDGSKEPKPWAPTRKKIGDLTDALAAVCMLPQNVSSPCWLDDEQRNGIIVSVANGLLDIEQRKLLPHTPHYFNQTSVPFDYDPQAPEPKRWHAFLKELWPNDSDAIKVLGEWYGYIISGKLDLHKILMTVGPTRGGKGVIARVLTALIGRDNVCGPTLNSLGGEFGLQPLLGKSLAIISDARFVGKNSGIVVERLLSISGEDTLTVNRKYRDQWSGKLPSRLHIISNELPRLGDASEAITGRIVLLLLATSWLGKEDVTLEDTLKRELTGILNWALQGLQRLIIENGNRFSRVASSDDAVNAMRDLASPVGAFVRERCAIDPKHETEVDVLYASYKLWAEDNGHGKDSKATFGRNLRAAVPGVSVRRPGTGPGRIRFYIGIKLGPDDAGDAPTVETTLAKSVDVLDVTSVLAPTSRTSTIKRNVAPTQGDGWPPICAHCGAAEMSPDNPIRECYVGDDRYLLHTGCERNWMDEPDPNLGRAR